MQNESYNMNKHHNQSSYREIMEVLRDTSVVLPPVLFTCPLLEDFFVLFYMSTWKINEALNKIFQIYPLSLMYFYTFQYSSGKRKTLKHYFET